MPHYVHSSLICNSKTIETTQICLYVILLYHLRLVDRNKLKRKQEAQNFCLFICLFFFSQGKLAEIEQLKVQEEIAVFKCWYLLLVCHEVSQHVSLTWDEIMRFHGRIPETNVCLISFCNCNMDK